MYVPQRLYSQKNKVLNKKEIKLTVNQTYCSFATTMAQLKFSDFSGEMFKGLEVLYISMSATTTQLLSSG